MCDPRPVGARLAPVSICCWVGLSVGSRRRLLAGIRDVDAAMSASAPLARPLRRTPWPLAGGFLLAGC